MPRFWALHFCEFFAHILVLESYVVRMRAVHVITALHGASSFTLSYDIDLKMRVEEKEKGIQTDLPEIYSNNKIISYCDNHVCNVPVNIIE